MAHRMLQGQQHVFHYRRFHINKSQSLGHGSYGAVYKAKCDQLPCAAKVLHPTILDPRDPGAGKIMERFQQECTFLENIRHPNIVQYLGITMDPESRLPVLLMELLDESLTKLLERSQQSLVYSIQVDICHDITLAVAYLHSNDIIHRDLSSNNVLIIAGRRAKVTDFGMSKLAGAAPTMTPLTKCPGTVAYMPPEALREPPRYTKMLDCFSEGVIMIQVCTRLWPEPGPRTKVIQDTRSPTGVIEMPIPETERRRNHIDLIDPNHALLPVAKECIEFQEEDRLSSEELCHRLTLLKESSEYRENVIQEKDEVHYNDNQVQVLTQQLQDMEHLLGEKDDEIFAKNHQLQRNSEETSSQKRQLRQLTHELEEQEKVIAEFQRTKSSLQRQVEELQQQLNEQSKRTPQPDNQVQVLTQQLQGVGHLLNEKDDEIFAKNHQLQRKNEEISSQKRQLRQLNQELVEQEKVITEIQQTKSFLERQMEELQLNQQNKRTPQPLPPYQAQDRGRQPQEKQSQKSPKRPQSLQALLPLVSEPQSYKAKKLSLDWRDGGKAFVINRGDAVVNSSIAYFMSYSGEIYSYDSASKAHWKWTRLSKYPYEGASLAVVCGYLTGIGGCNNMMKENTYTNKLLSLQERWVPVFPPMPTKRRLTSAISSTKHLIVAGGSHTPLRNTTIVEVMDTEALVWSTVASLPYSYYDSSGTICGDQVYMLGGGTDSGKTTTVLTCLLTELLQSSSSLSSSSSSIWCTNRAAVAPFYCSTCVAINGELLAVGGCDKEDKATAAIHKYNPATDSWDFLINMPTARYWSLVAVLPTNEMMVVGGKSKDQNTDKVEIAGIRYM